MLDPSIRDWVLVPILIVMFLQGVIREYMSVLLKDPKKTELKTIESMSQIQRSKRLRANGHNIPLEAYEMRKRYFVEKAFKAPEQKEGEMPQMPAQDPTAMMGMLKQNMGMMMIPNMLLMGWTSYFFSGFVIVRLPFSLTAKFKPMLQRGIQLTTLDVSYVSSLSWYFMLFMGFRGLFSVVLGANSATDQAKLMQQQVQGPAGPIQDFNKLNEAEKTELEIHHHEWVTPSAESRFKEVHNDR
uniref:ER membrane protein complex subunit 3 n=1 Tax=Lotharella globosa TaxID=91324 RepID=A0A7S3Z7D1_9EUKA